jgi:hypothetical protein
VAQTTVTGPSAVESPSSVEPATVPSAAVPTVEIPPVSTTPPPATASPAIDTTAATSSEVLLLPQDLQLLYKSLADTIVSLRRSPPEKPTRAKKQLSADFFLNGMITSGSQERILKESLRKIKTTTELIDFLNDFLRSPSEALNAKLESRANRQVAQAM